MHPISEEENNIIESFEGQLSQIKDDDFKGKVQHKETQLEFRRLSDKILDFLNELGKDQTSRYSNQEPRSTNTIANQDLPPSPQILPKEKRNKKFILIPLIVLLAPVLFFAYNFFLGGNSQPNSFSVLIHGHKGIEDRILLNDGTLELVHPQFPLRADIDAAGIAEFKEIPESLFEKGNGIQMKFKGVPKSIFILHPDSIYQLSKGETLLLELGIEGIDRIHGFVKNPLTEKTIPMVHVQVGGLSTVSDSFGYFNLHIPTELQSRAQTISLSKPGYQSNDFNEKHLEGDSPLVFQLNPE